jgi:Holliday junction resolvase RusA-like endonuclease
MTTLFRGRLPLPPGINDSYAIGYVENAKGEMKPRIIASAELKLFKELAAWQLKDAKTNEVDWEMVAIIQNAKKKRKHIPLEMKFSFYFNSKWRRDIDGGEKHAQDAVCRHLGINDNLIVEKHTCKDVDKENPRVEVEICIVQE